MTSTLIKNIAVAGIACVVLTMGVGPLSASDLDAQAQAISKAAATDYAIHLKALFEHLHANPELSFQEKNTSAKIADELRAWVGKEIGPIAKPKDIRFGDNLPKTRSGKIMRRLLRAIAKGESITQDTSTLENPAILEQLKQAT